MGKKSDDAFMNAMLTAIAACTSINVCSAEPANQAAIAGLSLASGVLTGGDFTQANGDTSGRKVTVAQQSDLSITASGTADHVVIDDGTNIYVTTATSQVLTSGGTVTTQAFDIEIADPV